MPRIIDVSQLQQFAAVKINEDPGAIGGPVVIPSCAQIVLDWALEGGKLAHNVLVGHYTGAYSGSVATANAIFTGLSTGAQAVALLSRMGTGLTFNGVTLRDVNSANQVITSSTLPGQPGTLPAPCMPNEMAIVVTLRTALSGRQNRGRMFVPGWAATQVLSGNIIDPVTVTDLQNWANTIIGVLNGSGFALSIGQKARAAYTGATGTLHPARSANSVPVTSLLVRDNHWDSQRRRGLK